jgi:excisionase family DNA binding protein
VTKSLLRDRNLLSVVVVAERLDVSTKTVRRLIASGNLRAHHVGRQVRVSEEDLALYLADGRIAAVLGI